MADVGSLLYYRYPASKRDIVVGNGAGTWSGRGTAHCGFGDCSTPLSATGVLTGASAEKNHITCANLRSFALVAFLIVPFAGLQAAFDVNLTSLGQILITDLRQPVPGHDVMPFGSLLTFPGIFVIPGIVGCHRKSAKRDTAGRIFQLRITPEPAHKNHFINGLCHRCSSHSVPLWTTFDRQDRPVDSTESGAELK